MHGEQVAVGTVLVLMLIEELLKEDVDFDAARESARAYDAAAWERGDTRPLRRGGGRGRRHGA